MITLINAYKVPDAAKLLYELLLERDSSVNISHRKMPTWREHLAFFDSKPYRRWYLIQTEIRQYTNDLQSVYESIDTVTVGACYLTRNNEVGIFIFRGYQGKGYAIEALNALITKHKPLKAISGKRSGRFIANVNPSNERSKRLFQKLGFVHIQETYAL